MAVPEKLYDYRSERRRGYKKRNPQKRSFQVFKNWTYDAEGNRGKPKASPNRLAKYNADLCSTYYENVSGSSVTIHGLGFDIDLARTSQQWLDGSGSVCWSKIGSFLAENESPILSFISAVASSTSGKGLGIYMPISPLEIAPTTASAQSSARVLQGHIITILNSHGIGADPAARGLIRDIPNYHNPKKQVDFDLMVMQRIVDNRRYPVVAELLRYTSKHPSIRRLKSEDPRRLFTGHRTSEKKIAALYQHLFDEALHGSIWLSGPEIAGITSLSKATLYKFLLAEHSWVDICYHGKGEGYELTFKPSEAHSERAHELLNDLDHDSTSDNVLAFDRLTPPESVEDGDRNRYLARCAVELKVKGVSLDEALLAMEAIAKRVPGARSSRNCRNVASIVISIYRNRPQTFGTNDGLLSHVLCEAVNRLGGNVSKEFPKKPKKGTTEGSFQSLGLDQEEEGGSTEENKNASTSCITQGEAVRPGDLPPAGGSEEEEVQSPADRPEFGVLFAYAPAAVESIRKGRARPSPLQNDVVAKKIEPQTSPLPPVFELPRARTFRTLKELRSHEYASMDAIDRFEKAFLRCRKRRTESQIVAQLESQAPEILRQGTRYIPSKGPYQRVLAAFSKLSKATMELLLRDST